MAGLSTGMERQGERNSRYHFRVPDFRETYVETRTLRVLHALDGHNPSWALEIHICGVSDALTTGPNGQCPILS